jgi:hypothetical protein
MDLIRASRVGLRLFRAVGVVVGDMLSGRPELRQVGLRDAAAGQIPHLRVEALNAASSIVCLVRDGTLFCMYLVLDDAWFGRVLGPGCTWFGMADGL